MKLATLRRLTTALPALLFVVPLPAEEQRAKAPGPTAPSAARIDLNTATEASLAAVPEIGPAAAKAILAARPFTSLNDLDRVTGLNSETLEYIRSRASVIAPPAKKPLGAPTHEKQPLGAPPAPATPEAARIARLPDLNRASEAELAAIPAIGPELAKKIVARRPFDRLEKLNELHPLSTEQLEQIRAAVRIEPATRAR
jgi:DNA uptake protein ComE-like DNA-binding protein